MTFAQARSALTWLWSICFLLLLAIPILLLAEGTIEADRTLLDWTDRLSATYVAQLGIILAYYFASKRLPGKPLKDRSPFYVAIATSLVWNGTVLALVLPTLWGGANLDAVGATIQALGSRLAWLTAPALGYFYGKSV